MKVVLLRYGEISLKSNRMRSKYEEKLIENIEKCLNAKNIAFDEIRKERGRIFVSGADIDTISKAVSNIFGVISSSPAEVVDNDLEIIKLLIKANAELNVRVKNGLTVYGYAIDNGFKEVAKLLRKNGAK